MFRVSEASGSTTCVACKQKVTPNELQVTYGHVLVHLRCLNAAGALEQRMFWAQPELGSLAQHALSAFISGTQTPFQTTLSIENVHLIAQNVFVLGLPTPIGPKNAACCEFRNVPRPFWIARATSKRSRLLP